MPKIIINEVEKNYNVSDASDFQGLYKNLLVEFAAPGAIVAKIKLNGEEIKESELPNRKDLAIKDIKSIELVIQTLPEIALNNINNAMEYLEKLLPGVEKAADLFRTKSVEEANKHYSLCLDGLAWFMEVIENISIALSHELEKSDIGPKNIKDYRDRLLSLTKEMRESQSKKDWVMLADMLEYELTPYLEEWRSILPLFVIAAQKKTKSLPLEDGN